MNIANSLQESVSTSTSGVIEEKIRTLNRRAWNVRKTDVQQAFTCACESLELYHSLPATPKAPVHDYATTLLILSTCRILMADYTVALEEAREALRYFEEVDDKHGSMRCLKNMAVIHGKRGEFQTGMELAHRSLTIAGQLDHAEGSGEALNVLGLLHWHTGRYAQALDFYLKGRLAFEQAGDRQGTGCILNNLGMLHIDLGDYDKALDYLFGSLTIKEELEDRPGAGNTLNNIGNVFMQRREIDKALGYYLRGRELKQITGDRQGEGTALSNIAIVYLQLGDADRALEYGTACLTLAREIGDRRLESYALARIAAACELQGKPEKAYNAYKASLAIRRDIGYRKGEMESLSALGSLLDRQEQYDEAERYLTEALGIASELQVKTRMYSIHGQLASLRERCNDPVGALFHYKQFHALQQEVYNEQSDQRLENIQVVYQVEQATRDAEICRLKNVELASVNAEVLRQKERLEVQARKIEEANRTLQEQNTALQQLNQEKDEFLGIAAHGLKNPLSGIVMTASMLKDYFDTLSRDELYTGLERIESTARRMEDIVSKLLSINAFESGQIELYPVALDLTPLITMSVGEYRERAAAKNIQLVTELAAGAVACADALMAREVVDNLISNAVKFSPLGSTVRIRTCTTEIPCLQCTPGTIFSSGCVTPHVRIEVQDEGPGINTEDEQRLFGKFERLSARPTGGEHSTGLGLSIVRKLTEAMGGSVWYEHRQERGATFIVELPAVVRPALRSMQEE